MEDAYKYQLSVCASAHSQVRPTSSSIIALIAIELLHLLFELFGEIRVICVKLNGRRIMTRKALLYNENLTRLQRNTILHSLAQLKV